MTGIRLLGWDRAAAWLLSATLHGAVLAAVGTAGFGRPAELPEAIAVDLVTFATPEPPKEASPQPSMVASPEVQPLRNTAVAAADRSTRADTPKPRPRPVAKPAIDTIDEPEVPATSGLADPAKIADPVAADVPLVQSARLAFPATPEMTTGREQEGAEEPPKPAMPAAHAGNPKPDYPLLARRKGLEGRVLVRVAVRPDGTAESAAVVQSSGHDILDRAARSTIAQWRFRPASIGHKPVAGTIDVPVVFRLSD